MKRAIKFISVTVSLLCVLVFCFVGYGAAVIPDSYIAVDTDSADTGSVLFTCRCESQAAVSDGNGYARSYPAQIRLFDTIPVKNSTVTVVHRRYVTLGGNVFGLRIFADGVIVTGVGDLGSGASPAKKAGIKQGDIIKRINP